MSASDFTEPALTPPSNPPCATYRLQLNRFFTFDQAAGLIEYLAELGITDVYTSPFLMARAGSLYGYDLTDHSRFNPEIGDEAAFLHLSTELKKHGMGLIVDIVPNHMCVSHPSNVWWWDVLENGPSSPYAEFFDIDWHPPKMELANRVLLPVLGDQFGRVLENQGIQVSYTEGGFAVAVNDTPLPLAPLTWTALLDPAVIRLRHETDANPDHFQELESIVSALSHLPGLTETDGAKLRERTREKEIARRRLSALVDASPQVRRAIEESISEINGHPGDPRSFDRLERLLDNQAYRLSFWRVAVDEINYRRFFDINDLAAIRVEDAEVFERVHSLIFDLVRKGHITGLRVDHPDGLADPERYFRQLQDACKAGASQGDGAAPFYIVVEKILARNEPLRTSWAVAGTTGYNFLNVINGLFVDRSRERLLLQLYRRFTGLTTTVEDLLSASKRIILQVAMSSELNVLARRLDHISEQHRYFRDFTLENLRDALGEVLAAFQVYRTYAGLDDDEVSAEDRRQINFAIRAAKQRNAAISESVFDFIESVLLHQPPDGIDSGQRAERRMFAVRFQQLSAPVMAKGVEDTAFYRYYPLAALNEVGGDPERFGVSPSAFHRRNQSRLQLWPHSMNATSTHDTKRSEDVRCRIDVLSEIPQEWSGAIRRWRDMNHRWKTVEGDLEYPHANEEYLLYQTLIGTWPFTPMDASAHGEYVARIQSYMEKAVREAKVHTSWINPNSEYEARLQRFVQCALDISQENAFLEDFCRFQAPIARAGAWNSISQVVLKTMSPGVPDFYQGQELWSFSLVDPDNRRPVDFELRRRMLSELRDAAADRLASLVERLRSNLSDGALKMHVTTRALRFRRDRRQLFSTGSYAPLASAGELPDHTIAFARSLAGECVVVLAGRFFLTLARSGRSETGPAWGDATIVLPRTMAHRRFEDVLTGQAIETSAVGDKSVIPLQQAFARLPVAILHNRD